MLRRIAILVIAVMPLISGCSSPTATAETITPAISTALHTSAITQPSGFATLIATTVAPRPLPSAAPSETPQSQLTLNVKGLSVQQLNDYLKRVFTDFNGFDPHLKLVPEDVSGDGQPDLVARDMDFGSIALAIVHKDINGDHEDDLIIYGDDGLFILLWTGETYSPPFRIRSMWGTTAAKYGSDINVTFQDWTDDHVLDVVYDEGSSSGGTGFEVKSVQRSVVHCGGTTCRLAWQDTLSTYATDYNTGGLAQYQITMQPIIDTKGKPGLRIVGGGFSIYCCSDMLTSSHPVESFDVYASTAAIYWWNGKEFKLSVKKVVSQEHIIDGQLSLQATSPAGFAATISWADNQLGGNANEYCQLLIDGKPVGPYWGCRHKFTRVEWKNITGDDENEIVVTTYSAGYPYGPDKLLSNETCMHQRILAYQWNGTTATEIANVAGCVISPDLYGVSLKDYDKDGQLEILAAPNGQLHNRAYKWNGKKFVLWSDVPLRSYAP